jgi:hypothetical protein
MEELTNEAYEHVFLSRWSHVKKKDKKSTRDLFSFDNFRLQIHGCIQHEKVIVSIKYSINHNFINVKLDKISKYPQRIFKAHKLKVKIFKFLNI